MKRINGRSSGHSVIEVALMAPWILFLFIAIFDFGFYAYALITTANAARVAVLTTASAPGAVADQPLACLFARLEFQSVANYSSLPMDCAALPLQVTAEPITGPDGADGSRVTVRYQVPGLIPLPFVNWQPSITRVAEMRVYGE